MYDEVFDWDDEIVSESNFTLLNEGDYPFEVVKFERGQFDGSAKLPACKMALVTVKVGSGNETTEITERLMLCKKMEWKLSQFFLAIGQKKHGEPLRMNWNEVIGAKGYCKVYVDTYTKDNGDQGQSNKIKKFYAYDEQPAGAQTQPTQQYRGWQAGHFN